MERSYGIIPLMQEKDSVKVLLVRLHSGGHWSFPKGHAEERESPKDTAQRELFEETGLTVERFLSDEVFSETYFFKLKGKLVKKQVDYFIAEVSGKPVPQEGEIAEWALVSPSEVSDLLTHKESKQLWESVKNKAFFAT